MNRKSNSYYWFVMIAGCGMIASAIGLGGNVAGLFFGPVANELGVGRGSVAATLTVHNLVAAFVGSVSARYVLRYGIKRMAVIGTVVQAVATFLLSICRSVLPMLILNAMRGFMSGMIGMVTVSIMVNYWFNKNNALMVSIAMGFSGLAGALLSPVFSSLIAAYGWRISYMILAALYIVFNLPALVLPIALKPEMKGMEPLGGKPEPPARRRASRNAKAETFSYGLFLVLAVYGVCVSSTTALPQHFAGIAESYNLIATGALMVSACMIANTAGKLMLGVLMDKIGGKIAVSLVALTVAAASFLLVTSRVSFILIAAAFMYGLCYSMGTVAISMLTRTLFGPEKYSMIYPKIALVSTLGNALFTTLEGVLYDLSGSYAIVITFTGIMVVIAMFMVLTAYRLKKPETPQEAAA